MSDKIRLKKEDSFLINKRRMIGVDENGYRVGESHHNAKLSDAEVDLIRDLHEEGMIGYRALARHFGCSRDTIAAICQYRRRTATPDRYKVDKTVCVNPKE